MHHVCCHAGSHDAGGKAGWAGCPLLCTKYVGNGALIAFSWRAWWHQGNLLYKRPADNRPFDAAYRSDNEQGPCREREESEREREMKKQDSDTKGTCVLLMNVHTLR